ncbi:hypothetical protein SHELI_v1c09880 [Spiroplasma helicoides]|uniref:AAA+ ATPase domain-containing protein n=1 Tax=Spiroplasma helicoides TaxID=216938 RepID=A0A1B3SLX2_9MOLU|nr:ATP-binding protein [Spiroplasma helicoides]AOG60935.1 hypothetical protein SHELI_v1c09880 [Spiroplasma helicoides]
MNNTLKEIIEMALSTNDEEAIQKVKEYAIQLRGDGNYNDASYLLSLIGSKETVGAANLYKSVNNKLLILEKEIIKENIYNKDNEDLNKLAEIINNKKNLRLLGNIRAIIYGKPGTGKTTFVNDLAHITKRELYSINASKLVSSLLGESQKNIDLLFKDILNNYKNSIFLIDELDSVIGSRDEVMNKEYHRMIGSFNLMLDKLLPETIIIAITNRIDMIDKATLRRFNIKMMLNEININKFKDNLFYIANQKNISFDNLLVNKLINLKTDHLNYALIEDCIVNCLLNSVSLEQSLFKILNITNNEILESTELSDKDKSKVLNISYSTFRRNKWNS